MATVKHRNPPFLKVIFSLSVDIMKANTNVLWGKKNNEENPRKKHNKRKIKISKVKKLKPNLFFSPNAAVHSPYIPLSPLLRCSHTLSLTLSPLSPILLCARVRVRFGWILGPKRSSQSEIALSSTGSQFVAIKGPKGGEIIMVRTERDNLTHAAHEYKWYTNIYK